MKEPDQIPGFWRFLWLFFMQPVTLHRLLRSKAIEPHISGWRLRKAKPGPDRTYALRAVSILVWVTPLTTGLVLSLAASLGFLVNFKFALMIFALGFTLGVVTSVALSVTAGVVFGVPACVAGGVAGGVAGAVAGGVAGEVAAWIILGVGWGIAAGVAVGISGGIFAGVARGISVSVTLGVVGGVVWGVGAITLSLVGGDISGVFKSVTTGIAWGVPVGAAVILSFMRVPLFFGEAPFQVLLFNLERMTDIPTLRFAPVLHHNLSYLPHPTLQAHILLTADREPGLVHQVLEACAIAPGQRSIGRRSLAALQARELARAGRERLFGPIRELEGEWLPGREGAAPPVLGFAEAARYLASAQATTLPHHKKEKLRRALEELRRLRVQIQDNTPLARALRMEALPVWQQAAETLLREAESDAAGQIPNPFRAGEPLSPEEGKETFRGREKLVQQVESLLGEPGHGCSIALLGPRRCGKTSLLKMLPSMLPDAVCILFDLQDNPIDQAAAFFPALERQAREQARRDRQLDLPRLPEGTPFEAASRWLERLDQWAGEGDRRILLCIDEFERLESLFPGSRRELLQLMGLLRATIQHRRRIRVLVSGAAPFDELDSLWNDHLINAREVRLRFLDEAAATGLLRKPIAEFPDEAIPAKVAWAIFERTGGQPYLVQLYGASLISRLNREDRKQASLEDLQPVEEEALQQATYYFRDVSKGPGPAKAALLELAFDRTPELDSATRRWLRRRLLITEDNQLSVPALGAWLRGEEAS